MQLKQIEARVWALLVAACLLPGCLSGTDANVETCDGGPCVGPALEPEGGLGRRDAATDTGPRTDAPPMAAPPVATDDEDAGAPDVCSGDDGCDDAKFCSGVERCQPSSPRADARGCVSEPGGACDDRSCDEAKRSCNCEDADQDGDGYNAKGCSQQSAVYDCDDSDAKINPDATELCDAEGVDEDCNPSTVGDLDADADGYISEQCRNFDPVTGRAFRGSKVDCDDASSNVHPDQSENPCNGIDDNCDGIKEEAHWTYYADRDGDRFGDQLSPIFTDCSSPPEGYVLGDRYDCDDTTSQRAPSNLEVCDVLDNDCDERSDESVDYDSLPRVSRMCVAGETQVTCESAWAECDDDMDELCETPRGTLSNCRACGQSCRFSCGADACDELKDAAMGGQHGCALSEAGYAACWGNNARGQLGIDSTNNAATATRVFELPGVTKLALGARHSCAIAGADATLYCWGDNAFSQLGVLGAANPSLIPRKATGLLTSYLTGVSDVALGSQHSCAIVSGGRVACWGAGDNGRLGDDEVAVHTAAGPQQARRLAPHQFMEDATRIAAGAKHTCIVTEQATIECWGDNTSAQLGVGNTNAPANAAAAIPSTGLGDVIDIVAGAYHTCALRDGRVHCWGSNFYGQLGRTLDQGASSDGNALEVPGLSDIASIIAGDFFSCALARSGTLSCWGNNGDRQLGAAEPATRTTPIALGLQGIRSAAAGGASLCALDGASQLYCWGSNAAGQLGRGPSGPESQPTPEPIHWLAGSTP